MPSMPSLLTRKRSKRLTGQKMAAFYSATHAQLNATYWEHAENHKVCLEAMEELASIHVSKKADEQFFVSFIEIVREVFSHAGTNIPQLEMTDVERNYWAQLSSLFAKVFPRLLSLDGVHPLSRTVRMVSLMSYSSLYSLYKEVAQEGSQLVAVRETAKELVEGTDTREISSTEAANITQLYEAIEMIYMCRNDTPKRYKLADPPVGKRRSSSSALSSLSSNEHDMSPPDLPSFPSPREEDPSPLPPPSPIALPLLETPKKKDLIAEYVEKVSEEVVLESLKEYERELAEEKRKRKEEEAESSLEIPSPVHPLPSSSVTPTSVFMEHPLKHRTTRVESREEKKEDEEEKGEGEGPVMLSPFDPEKCFKEKDKVPRYGRKSLFDDPLPVIVSFRPRKATTTSISIPEIVVPSPPSRQNSQSYKDVMEDKMVRAVLGGVPVSPMDPPPLDEGETVFLSS